MKCISVILSSMLFSSTALAGAWKAAADPGDCDTYNVKAGDSCWSIMRATNATFAQIISWNADINPQCSNLDEFEGQDICISNPEGNYAIPSNSQGLPDIITTTAPIPSPTPNETEDRCGKFHLVKEGEDCDIFILKYQITKKDFLFLNPQVSEDCTDLWLGYYYCVAPVGDISTYPGYLPPTTTTEFIKTPTTKIPRPDAPMDWFDHKPLIPVANATRKDCFEYFYIRNLTQTPAIADCWSAARAFGISAEELVLWNPSLGQDNNNNNNNNSSGYDYPCTMSESSSYCIALETPTPAPINEEAPPSPRAAGEIENCTAWHSAKDYHTCEDLVKTTRLTFEEFFAMNPSVKKDCTGLTAGTYYCISNVKGGGPPTSLPISTPTTTVPPTSTTTSGDGGVVTPTPTQEGMIDGCGKFHKIESGDLCNEIAEEYGITRVQFDEWNPDAGSDCSNLWLGYYVCVGLEE